MHGGWFGEYFCLERTNAAYEIHFIKRTERRIFTDIPVAKDLVVTREECADRPPVKGVYCGCANVRTVKCGC